MLDIDRMRRIAEDLYVTAVSKAFGEEGTLALRLLIDTVMQIYRRVAPDERTAPLIVVVGLTSKGGAGIADAARTIVNSPSVIEHELDGACSVEIQGNTRLMVRPAGSVDPLAVSKRAIVYVYRDGKESFFVNGAVFDVINPSTMHASVFARPTFSSLRNALEEYKSRVARETGCLVLRDIWADDKRLFLRIKPEATMRRSLNQYLAHVMQNAEVRPEQIVDESHPVDIKVTWSLSDQRAILEIKWLGDCRNDDGSVGTTYRDARAREGAKQLAEYLDSSATWGSSVRTRGYLVVFDARRRGLDENSTDVTTADGLHYANREIAYDPDYASMRKDFEQPLRFFMDPICS
jgi:hypothetical protein